MVVIGAVGMVIAPKAVYSAVFLAMTMIILAIFYIAQGALFLGVVQVVVYTGAVMMLFLFVLMLVGVDSSDSLVETIRGQRTAAIAAAIGFGLLLIGGLGNASTQWARSAEGPGFTDLEQANAGGNVEGLAELIFLQYVWAFELTGALLITATIGAMVLAHRERFDTRKGQRELSQDRFRRWAERTVGDTPTPTSPHCRVLVSMPGTTPSTCRPCCRTVRIHGCRSAGCFTSADVTPSEPCPMRTTASMPPAQSTAFGEEGTR